MHVEFFPSWLYHQNTLKSWSFDLQEIWLPKLFDYPKLEMIELVSTLDEKNVHIWNVSISSKIIHTCINDLKSCLFFVAGINIPEGQSSE